MESNNLTPAERAALQVEAWKTVVQVQQHFNDIEMKIRGLALTVVTAGVAATGLAVRSDLQMEVGGREIAAASLVLLATFFVWAAFYFMDDIWYHRLLKGAVSQGEAIEKELANVVPGITLAHTITKQSAVRLRSKEVRSTTKIRVFYGAIGALLLGAALLMQLSDVVEAGTTQEQPVTPSSATSAPTTATSNTSTSVSPPTTVGP